jgi:lysozyme
MTTRLFGIDVSHHQGELSWSNVASGGVDFCFIKATEGTSFVDNRFERNWQGAQAAGLFRGAYHFGRVGADAATQAAHFHAVVGPLGFRDLPPVLDIEEADGHSAEEVVRWTKEFLIKAKELFGRTPVVYTGHFWREQMKNPDDKFFGDHPLWLAGYVSELNLKVPAAWKRWTFWQYTEGTHNGPKAIPGVPPCDQNYFEGSVSDLRQLCSNTSPPPAPLPDAPANAAWPGVFLVWLKSPAMSGEVVRRWQARMGELGFSLEVDGAYGPRSKRVCQAFQKNRGLTADGIVGRKTWEAAFAS